MAEAITEQPYGNPEHKVYGILYDIKGDAASPIQFMLTDSVHHVLRGALYFDAVPNKDSIAPVLNYVRKDIIRMLRFSSSSQSKILVFSSIVNFVLELVV